MSTRVRGRWVGLAVLVAGMAVGGIAYGSITGSGGVFNACYKTNGGQLRIVNSASDCLPSETATQWNQTGQPGATGASGATGPAGPTQAYLSDYGDAVSLDGFGLHTVREFTLPQGSYVITAKVFVDNESDQAAGLGSDCLLLDPSGEILDGQSGSLSGRYQSNLPDYDSWYDYYVLETTFSGAGTFKIQCYGGGSPYIYARPRIIAMKVDTITTLP